LWKKVHRINPGIALKKLATACHKRNSVFKGNLGIKMYGRGCDSSNYWIKQVWPRQKLTLVPPSTPEFHPSRWEWWNPRTKSFYRTWREESLELGGYPPQPPNVHDYERSIRACPLETEFVSCGGRTGVERCKCSERICKDTASEFCFYFKLKSYNLRLHSLFEG